MSQLNINSLDDVKIYGFDLHLKNENGEIEVIKDALIDIAKGSLQVVSGEKVISMQELVKSSKVNLDSLSDVFLENVISPDEQELVDEDAQIQQELEQQKEQQELRQQELEAELERLSELKSELEAAEKELELKEKQLEEKAELDAASDKEMKPDGPSDAEDFIIEVQEQVTDVENSDFEFDGKGPNKNNSVLPPAPSVSTGTSDSSSSSSSSAEDLPDIDIPPKPIQLSVMLDTADDSGKAGDFITNKTSSLTFTGITEAGATVTLIINGATYQVVADTNGKYTVEVKETFVDGDYDIKVTAVSTKGATSTVNKTLTIDTQAPDAPTVELAKDSDLGVSDSDDLTSDNTPTFEGTAEANATIRLTIDGRTYETKADAKGKWSLTVTTKVKDGEHTYQVVAIDEAGNKSEVTTDKVTIDTTIDFTGGLKQSEDVDTGHSHTDGITQNNSPVFAGTVEKGSTVKLYFNGSSTPLEILVNEDGTWLLDSTHPSYAAVLASLTDGTYSYKLVAEDAAGNVSTIEKQIVVDTKAPIQESWRLDASSDSGRSDSDGITNNKNPVISGVAEPKNFITVTINGHKYKTQADANGKWQITVSDDLPHGEHEFTVDATDAAGNTSSVTGDVTIDLTPPTGFSGDMVEDSSVDTGTSDDDKITQNTMPTFEGTAEPNALIKLVIDGKVFEALTGADGKWVIKIDQPLSQGTHNYTLTAYDVAGNKIDISDQSITIDTEAIFTGGLDPEFDTGISDSDNLTKFNQPTFSGSGEEGARIILIINTSPQTVIETTVVNGGWSIDLAKHGILLDDRTYDVTLKTVDIAGNEATLPTQQITVDTLPPQLFKGGLDDISDSGTSDDDDYTSHQFPIFSGVVDAGAHVTLLINGKKYQATVDPDGNWSVAVTDKLPDGPFNYELIAMDDAGNKITQTGTITIDSKAHLTGGLDNASDTGKFDNDNYTKDTNPVFSGTAEEGSTVTLTINGKQYSIQIPDNNDGVTQKDVPWEIKVLDKLQPDGVFDYTITTTDKAGNSSQVSGSIEVDTTTHVTAQLSDDTQTGWDDEYTSLKQPEFQGTGEPNATITIRLTKGSKVVEFTTKVGADGKWFKKLDKELEDGSWSYEVIAEDLAGVTATQTGTVTVDTQDPEFTGGIDASSDTNINNDGVTQNRLPKFSGTGEYGNKVVLMLNGKTYTTTVDADGNWEINLKNTSEFADGTYNYTLVSTDRAGNTTTVNKTLVVDNTASVQGGIDSEDDTGVSSSDGITQTRSPTFSGSGDAGATVMIDLGNGIKVTTVVGSDGKWSINLADKGISLSDNVYTYKIILKDVAGNTDTFTGKLVVDNTAPGKLTGGLDADSDKGTPGDGYTNVRNPWFSGETDVGAVVTVIINGKTYLADMDGLGGWRVNITDELPNGSYDYKIISTDVAGNSVVKNGTVHIDTILESFTHGLSDDPQLGDSGDVGDNMTKHPQPTFEGTAEPGSQIKITINNKTYTATADTNGHWSLKVTDNLIDPSATDKTDFNYSITVTDKAGNTETESGKITVDPSTFVSGDLAAESDSGVPFEGEEGTYDDNYTNSTTPLFSGNGEPGATITLTIDGHTYTAVVMNSGIWQIKVTHPLVQNGEVKDISYTIEAEDAAGNTATVSGNITVDKQKPINFNGQLSAEDDHRDDGVTDDRDSDGITNVTRPTFVGTVDGASEEHPIYITLTIDGKQYTTKVTSADGAWQIHVPDHLADGTYNYTLKATDKAGNVTNLGSQTIVIDTSVEEINGGLSSSHDTGSSNSDAVTSYNVLGSDQLHFNGTAEPFAEIFLEIDSKTYKAVADEFGNWQVVVTDRIAEGEGIEYTLKSIDLAGNIKTEQGTLTIDNTPPDIQISVPPLTNDNQPDFNLSVNEDIETLTIIINGISYELEKVTAGDWTIDGGKIFGDLELTTKPGDWDGQEYGYTVVGTDAAGNKTEVDGKFVFDNQTFVNGGLNTEDDSMGTVVGNVQVGTNSDNITNNNQPSFSGMAEKGSTVTLIFSNQTVIAQINADGSWTATLTKPLPEGENSYTIVATDAAGNTAEVTQTVTIDTTKPVVTLDPLSDIEVDGVPAVGEARPTFSGIGEPGTAVVIIIAGQTRSVIVGDDGRWSITVPSDIAHSDKPYDYQVYSVDKAGNQSDVVTGSLKVDLKTHVTGGLSSSSDTGFENNDGVTNDNTPTFNGQGEVGATVTVTIYASDGSVIRTETKVISGKPGSNGSWTITFPELEDNAAGDNYFYQVSVTDPLGNNMVLDKEELVVDTQAPEAPTFQLQEGTDSGYDEAGKHDFITNVIPVFEGTVEPGGKITIVIDKLGTFELFDHDGDGKWNLGDVLDGKLLLQGSYDFTITATDKAGNVSATQTGTLVYDKVSKLQLTPGLAEDLEHINDQTPTFSGVAEHNSKITIVISGTDKDGNWIEVVLDSFVVTDKNGNWSITLPDNLPESGEGGYTYNVTSVDVANNSTSVSGNMHVDITKPDLDGGLDAVSNSGDKDDELTNEQSPSFSGTVEAGCSVVLIINGREFKATVTGNEWRVDLAPDYVLADNQIYDYKIIATDAAGNETVIENSIEIDNSAPVIGGGGLASESDSGDQGDQLTNEEGDLVFSGTITDTNVVTMTFMINGVDYSQYLVIEGNKWTVRIPDALNKFVDGQVYEYTITATDKAGNEAVEVTKQFEIDRTAPDAPTVDTDSLTNDTTPTFTITAEAGSDIKLYINGELVAVSQDSNGNWTFTLPEGDKLFDGGVGDWDGFEHDYKVVSTDAAGNESFTEGTITVDTQTFVTGGLSASDQTGSQLGATSNHDFTFSGTAEQNSVVRIVFTSTGDPALDAQLKALFGDDLTLEVRTGAGQTNWSIDVTGFDFEGEFNYTIHTTDSAGNEVSTGEQTLVVDRTPPQGLTLNLAASSDSNIDGDNVTNLTEDGVRKAPVFEGNCEAGTTITLTITSADGSYVRTYQVEVGASGKWKIETDDNNLPDGEYHVKVEAVDSVGNTTVVDANHQLDMTVDTQIDATAGLATESDSGADFAEGSDSDNITNVTKPILSGTGDEGDIITLNINGAQYQTTVINGKWSIDLATARPISGALGEFVHGETYYYTVEAKDLAGNTVTLGSNQDKDYSITIDKVAEIDSNGGLENNPLSDTGASASDGITNAERPVFSGSVEPNSKVQIIFIKDGVETVVDAVVTADGSILGASWQYQPDSILPEGEYSYVVKVTDQAGNVTELPEQNLVIDRTIEAPTVGLEDSAHNNTGSSQTDNITQTRNPILEGKTEPFATVTVEFTVGLEKVYASVTADKDGNWKFQIPDSLADGTYEYSVHVTDVAGNTTSSTNNQLIIDNTAPAGLTGGLSADSDTSHGHNHTQNTNLNFNGQVEAQAGMTVKLQIFLNGQLVQTIDAVIEPDTDGDGLSNWKVNGITLDPNQSYDFVVTATDAAGNSTSLPEQTVVIDTIDPEVTGKLTSESDTGIDDGITYDETPTFSGTGEDGCEIIVMVGNTVLGKAIVVNGKWTIDSIALKDGDYGKYTIIAKDKAGNTTVLESSENLVIDTSASLTGGLETTNRGDVTDGEYTNDETPVFSGTADAGSTIYITLYDKDGNKLNITPNPIEAIANINPQNGQAEWRIELGSQLVDGDYRYEIVATDVAGNTTEVIGSDFTVDLSTNLGGLQLDSSSDTGLVGNDETAQGSLSDQVTSDDTPTITGIAEVGAKITVVIEGVGTYYATVTNPDGSWSITVDNKVLGNGTYNYTVTTVDKAGNQLSGTSSFEVDKTAPDPVSQLHINGAPCTEGESLHTNTVNPVFSGQAEAGSRIYLTIAGKTYYTDVKADGSWEITVSDLGDANLEQGVERDYSITVSDVAGNVSSVVNGSYTLDLTTSITDVDLSEESDSNIVGDNITNSEDLTFNGQGEPGAKIYYHLGDGTFVYLATVGDNGEWSGTLPPGLADGNYTIYIKSEDKAGNESAISEVEFEVDRTAPTGLTNDGLTAETDSGIDDNRTNQDSFSLTGKVEPNTVIKIVIGGIEYPATVDENGNWTVNIDLSANPHIDPDGTEYTYDVIATDTAGNTSVLENQTVIIDKVASLTGDLQDTNRDPNSDIDYAHKQPTFSGTAEAHATITITLTSANGGVPIVLTVKAGADGRWTFQVPTELEETEYSYKITVKDVAGNTTDANGNEVALEGSFTVDQSNVLPNDDIKLSDNSDSGIEQEASTSSDQITNVTKPVLEGTGEVGAHITVTMTFGDTTRTFEAVVGADGRWSVQLDNNGAPLTDGNYSYTVTSVDKASNSVTSVEKEFEIDTQAPNAASQITVNDQLQVGGVNLTNKENPVFEGKAEAGSWVHLEIDGVGSYWVKVGADGRWKIDNVIDQGNDLDAGIDRNYTITVVDKAGNSSSVSNGQYTLDENTSISEVRLASASDSGSSNSDNITNAEELTFSGKGEPGATIYYRLGDGTYKVLATVGDNGKWSASIPNSEVALDGDYTITFKSQDKAGNYSPESSLDFTVDRTAPLATNEGLADSTDSGIKDDELTKDEMITLTGTAEVGSTVTLVIDGKTYTMTVSADGQWSFDVDLSGNDHTNPDGTQYDYTVTATDTAGNSTVIANQTVTIDTVARLEGVDLKAGADGDSGRDQGHFNDDITNAERPVFTGTAEQGATVTLYIKINGVFVQSGASIVVNAENGKFEIQLADGLTLAGDYEYRIDVEDTAGNTNSVTGSFEFDNSVTPITVDLDSSSDTGSSNSDNITNDTTPTFNVTVEPDSLVVFKLYQMVDGKKVLVFSTTETVVDGNWQVLVPEGLLNPENGGSEYHYEVTATDKAGNTTTQSGDSFIVDNFVEVGNVQLDNVSGNHQGAGSNGLDITNEMPVFSGTAEGGATVELWIKVNGQFVKVTSTVLDGDHTELNKPWTITIGNEQFTFDSGTEYEYKVVVTDTAGNVDEQLGDFIFDNTTSVSAGLDSSTDLGSSNSDNLTNTNDDMPIISGQAEAGSTITLTIVVDGVEYTYVKTLQYPTGDQVNTNVDWSIDLADTSLITKPANATAPNFTNGDYSYHVSNTDVAGNSNSTSGNFVVDNSAPVITGGFVTGDASNDTGLDNNDGITNNNRPVFEGTYSDIGGSNNAVDVYITIDGRTFKATAVDGQWTLDFSKPVVEIIGFGTPNAKEVAGVNVELSDEVDKSYTVTAVDAAGNKTQDSTGKVTIDTTTQVTADLDASTDAGPSNDDNKTNVTSPIISGSGAEPGSVIYILFGPNSDRYPAAGQFVTVDDEGNWSIELTGALAGQPNGIYDYTVHIKDPAGNTAIYDSSKDGNGIDFNQDLPQLNPNDGLVCDADNNTGLDQNDHITNAVAPDFSGQVAMPDGAEFTITITFKDANGNIVGTYSSAKGEITIVPTGNGMGQWQLNGVILGEGEYTYTVEASNDYGNSDSFDKELVIDRTPPALTIENVTLATDSSMPSLAGEDTNGFGSDNKTNDTTPTIHIGLNESNAKVELFILDAEGNIVASYSSHSDPATITWNAAQNRWEVTCDELAQGNYQYYVKATDVAGNITTTENKPLEIDTEVSGTGSLSAESDTGVSNDDEITNNDALKFEGKVEDNDPGARVKVTLIHPVSGEEIIKFVTVNPDGSWEISFDSLGLTGVQEVKYKIEVWDVEGNHSVISEPGASVTVDKTPPASATDIKMPEFVDGNINNTGAADDWITKLTDPVITGQAEADATIEITVYKMVLDANGNLVIDPSSKQTITTTCDADGNWQFQFGQGGLNAMDPNSSYQFEVDVFDKAGNKNENTFIGQVTNDSKISVNVDLAEEDKLGQLPDGENVTPSDPNPNDNIIRVPNPTLEGKTDTDVTEISVVLRNAVTGASHTFTEPTVVLNADGTWSIDLAALGINLEDGNWTATVTVKDVAGNEGMANIKFEVDTTPPVAPTASLATGIDVDDAIDGNDLTNNHRPTFSGTAEEGTLIVLVIKDAAGNVIGRYEATERVDASGRWSITVDDDVLKGFGDGRYSYYVSSTDEVGHTTSSAESSFVIDTTKPILSNIKLVTSDDSDGLITSDDGWLSNSLSDELTITGTVDASSRGGTIKIYIDGSSDAAIVININDIIDNGGNFSFSLSKLLADLSEGHHTIQIVAQDPAGNTTVVDKNLILDYSVEVDGDLINDTGDPDDGWTYNPLPEFAGTTEEESTVTLIIYDAKGNEVYRETYYSANGKWSFNPTLDGLKFPDGEYSYQISATDKLGNVTTGNDLVTGDFFVDTQAPEFKLGLQSVTVQEEGQPDKTFGLDADKIITSDRTLTFSGQSESSSQHGVQVQAEISIYLGAIAESNLLGRTVVGPDGRYTIETGELPYGIHTIYLVSTDKAGNKTIIEKEITVRPDYSPVKVFLDDESNSSDLEDTLTNVTNPWLHGEATPGSTVSVTLIDRVTGMKVTFTTVVEIDGTWKLQLGSGPLGNFGQDEGYKPIDGSVSDEDLANGHYYLPDGDYTVNVNVNKDGVTFPDDSFTTGSLNGGLTVDTGNVLSDVTVVGSEDGLTNSDTLLITGKTDPFAEVTVVLINSETKEKLILKYTANAQGSFTVSASDLEDGVSYEYYVTSVDKAGNVAGHGSGNVGDGTGSGNIVIDRITPEIEGGIVADDSGIAPGPDDAEQTAHYITRDDSPTFSGTLTGDFNDAYIVLNGGERFYIAKDGKIAVPEEGGFISLVERAGQPGVWDWTYTLPPMADGTYNFELVTNDVAGNEDKYEGIVQVKTAINFQVALEHDSAVSTDFITNELDTVNGEEGYLSFNCATEAGNTIYAWLYDEHGNEIGYVTMLVDATNSSKISFKLPIDPATGKPIEGKYTVKFKATDEAGNTLSSENQEVVRDIVYDSTPPEVTAGLEASSDSGDILIFGESVASDNKTMVENPVIAGSGEPEAEIYIKIYRTVYNEATGKYEKVGDAFIVATTRVSDNGSWSFQPKPGELLAGQADGTFVIEVTSKDTAGNVSGEPESMDLTIRTTPPELGDWLITPETDKDGVIDQVGTDPDYPVFVVNNANDKKTINFEGKGATPGDTIILTINGIKYSTKVNLDGTWKLETDPMPDMEYPYILQAVSDVGHVVTETGTIIFDSGITLTTDFIEEPGWYWTHNTNNPNPEVKIYTEKGNEITITVVGPDGVAVKHTFIAESTAFLYKQPDGFEYPDGSYTMTVVATDKAGNTTSNEVKFVVDTKMDAIQPPQVSIFEDGVVTFKPWDSEKDPDTGLNIFYTNDADFEVQIPNTTSTGERIHAFYVIVRDMNGNEITRIGTDTSTSGDVFRLKLLKELALIPGGPTEFRVEIIAKDKAGNTPTDANGDPIETEFIVSVNPGKVDINLTIKDAETGDIYDNENLVHVGQDSPLITGTSNPDAIVSIRIYGNGLKPEITAKVIVGKDGSWQFAPGISLPDGLYEIDIVITDKWGNNSHLEHNILVDTFAPIISMDKVEEDIDYKTDDVLWNTDSGTISGIMSDKDATLTIQINGGAPITVHVDSNGNWYYNFDGLIDGETITVTITATDKAGNSSSKEFDVTYDSREEMPFIDEGLTRATDTGLSSSDNITSEDQPSFEGRGVPGSEIRLEIDGKVITAKTDEYGEWSIKLANSPITLAEGNNHYTLTEIVNGSEHRTTNGNVVLDTTPPELDPTSIDYLGGKLTGQLDATEAGAKIDILNDSGSKLGSAIVQGDGSWSVEVADSQHSVDIVITDVAGNKDIEHDFVL